MGKRISSKNIKTVAIFETVYSLFIFLLMTTKSHIEETLFVFGYGVPKNVICRFPNYVYMDLNNRHKIVRQLDIFKFTHFILNSHIIKKATSIVGHDHLWFSPIILRGGKKMTVIEDGTANYNSYNFEACNCPDLKAPKLYNLFKLFYKHKGLDKIFGASDSVEKVILTNIASIPNEIREKSQIIDLRNIWEKTDKSYKNYILSLFDVSLSYIKQLQRFKVLILTQPYYRNAISEAEQAEIYAKIIANHDPLTVLIKKHPTDYMDYNKYIKDISVFDKIIPMEILSLLGITFEKAYSISSTALFSLPDKTEKIFLGHSCHPKLLSYYGSEINFKELIGNKKGNFLFPIEITSIK